jgi:hypothetical protein
MAPYTYEMHDMTVRRTTDISFLFLNSIDKAGRDEHCRHPLPYLDMRRPSHRDLRGIGYRQIIVYRIRR